jgi:hypothetical protein
MLRRHKHDFTRDQRCTGTIELGSVLPSLGERAKLRLERLAYIVELVVADNVAHMFFGCLFFVILHVKQYTMQDHKKKILCATQHHQLKKYMTTPHITMHLAVKELKHPSTATPKIRP